MNGFVRAPLLLVPFLLFGGCRERRRLELPNPDEAVTVAEVARADVERGERLFAEYGCPACHTIHGARLAGPPLDAMAGRMRPLKGGESVMADEVYLRESIDDPSAKIVDGYLDTMPSYGERLRDDEIDALVDYLVLLGR